MTVVVYRSSDASAPTLSGTAGDMCTVLDAVLVNGYGAKASQGYSIEFTGTNKRVYRSASGNRLRLRIDDSNAQNTRVIGYESMSSVDAGTNGFPTEMQLSGGLYWLKSSAASATTRDWVIIGNGTYFHMIINSTGVTGTTAWVSGIYGFGDFSSFKPSDTYGTQINGNISTTITALNSPSGLAFPALAVTILSGRFIARGWNLIGGSIPANQVVSSLVLGTSSNNTIPIPMGSGTDQGGSTLVTTAPVYPNAADGQLMLGRLYLGEKVQVLRGSIPGFWAPAAGSGTTAQALLPNIGDKHIGTGDLDGKTFEFFFINNSSNTCKFLIEISDTW